MAILTPDRLHALLQVKSGPCISIYIPTHRRHPETQQDPVRFRNALKEAERLLAGENTESEIRALLDPIEAMPHTPLSRHPADARALRRSRDVLEEFRLPLQVAEQVVVADSFHVRPLIHSLHLSERYFVLAVSQNGVQLFEGSTMSLARLEVPGMPESADQVSPGRRRVRAVSAHATSTGGGSQRVHGAGTDEPSTEEELAPYFRAIDRALVRLLRKESAPVILAGVGHYLPAYRRVSRLKQLAETIVQGSPDGMTADELQSRAWPVARSILDTSTARAIDQFERASKRGRALDRLEDILPEARRGRVRRLFLARGTHAWGRVDPVTGRVLRTETQQDSHDDDLLDDIAEAVYSHGGQVITLPPARMPRAAEVAAELR
jgi:hypothetical protein